MPARNAQERTAYDAARKRREQMLLRFTPEEALRVRAAAAGAGKSLSAFVLCAVDDQPRPIVDLAEVAALSTSVAALLSAPKAVRDLEADLGRLSGRLAHLFTLNYERAAAHREEIHETLWALRELLRVIPSEIAALQAATAEPRAEVARVLRDIAAALEVA